MDEVSGIRQGPVEGLSRILGELLRTPNFKKTVRILLNEMDPENAALLVRTLMWEDAEFFLGILGSAPALLNVAIEGTNELLSQLATFPQPLLAGFLAEIIPHIQAESLGEVVGGTLRIIMNMAELHDESLGEAASGFTRELYRGVALGLSEGDAGSGAAAAMVKRAAPLVSRQLKAMGEEAAREGSDTSEAVAAVAEAIKKIAKENPEFVREVAAPLALAWREALGSAEAGKKGDEPPARADGGNNGREPKGKGDGGKEAG